MKIKRIPILKKVDEEMWVTLDSTELNIFGGTIVIPKGFECDMASIPQAFQWAIPKRGKEIDVAIVHDYLYSEHSIYDINRKEADYIFYQLMLWAGMKPSTAKVIYRAVRLFGNNHFEYNKLCGIVTCERKARIDKRTKWLIHLDYVKNNFPLLYKEMY